MTLGLVGTLAVIGFTGKEAWPFSSFKLFSSVRTDEVWSRRMVAVSPDGVEHPVDLYASPVGARSAIHELPHLTELPMAERRAQVRTFLELAHMHPRAYRTVRVYRVRLTVATDDDASARLLARHLVAEVPL